MTKSPVCKLYDRCNSMATIAAVAFAMCAISTVEPAFARQVAEKRASLQTSWSPMPMQRSVREGYAQLPGGAKLWFWDTGGPGEPVVLLHPATGSGAIWGHQQPVLAEAGYRVIGYSRRGHYRSSGASPSGNGSGARDLKELLDHLRLNRVHLVGSAAGGFVVPDFALSYPERLLTITIANSLGGVVNPEYRQVTQALVPKGFHDMPATFQELGPSYRAANPSGTAHWAELERSSKPGPRVPQMPINTVDWAAVGRIKTPALIISSDADLYMPPSRARGFAARLPNAELTVIPEAGHSAYWEQPIAFNKALISFLRRHRSPRR